MTDFTTKVKTINSAVRTVIITGVLGVVSYGSWLGYDNYIRPSAEAKRAMADLELLKERYEENEAALKQTAEALQFAEKDNERLETSMKLLKINRRLANITVLDKGKNEDGTPFMEVGFTEVDERGNQIGSTRNYTIQGEKLYVDGWIVSFEDKYVEENDELRSASLYVFKSIYGDNEKPSEGQRLDVDSADNGPPGIYKSADKVAFEQKIWSDIWKVSNDSGLQKDYGIRAAHGHAGYIKPIKGKTYQVHIRASGGMTLTPIEEP